MTAAQKALVAQRRDLGGLIQGQEFRDALKAVLPKHCTAERFARIVLTATMRTPDLLKCSRESFFKCCFDLSALGLEPDGRRAHLIPRKTGQKCACGDWRNQHQGQGNSGQCSRCDCKSFQQGMECTLVVDYKGLVDLVRRSGEVAYIHADVVFEGDEWDFCYGSDAFLKHKPNLKGAAGNVVAVYSFVKLKDGTEDFIVLSEQQIEQIRNASPAKDDGPWKSWWDEMAKKSAFRRHSKWLPFSSELREVIEKDDEYVGVDTTTELPGRSTLSLDMFRPSDDEHRGHDDSMAGAGQQQGQDTAVKAETAQTTTAAAPRSEPKPEPTKGPAAPPKRYPKGEMPAADDCRLGLECYHDGGHFKVVPDGDFQRWDRIGDAPAEQPEKPVEAPAAAAKSGGGGGRDAAKKFNF
jgi:recombination protein RecT